MTATAAPANAEVVRQPDTLLLERHFRFTGHRCHAAPSFLAADAPGVPLVWFGQTAGGVWQAAGVAYERRGRVFGRLTFPTPPVASAADGPLWETIRDYCRAHRLATTVIHSYEGRERVVAPLGPARLTERAEYELELTPLPADLLATFSENHRRNIKKAQKQGLVVRTSTAADAAAAHAALFQQSMDRRAARGETVPLSEDAARVRRLLNAGVARVVQVERDGRALASLCILTSPERAYYHSGGSAPEGFKVGASHYAMWHAMLQCRGEGIRWFNLSGASDRDSSGLAAFKMGFRPRPIPLAHAVYTMDLPPLWRLVRRVVGR